MRHITLTTIAGLLTFGCTVVGAETPDLSKIDVSKLPPPAKTRNLTYDKDIRPMLEASCFRCHGDQRPKGGLKLNSLESLLKGGEDGKVVVPGDSKKSLLVIAAAQIDEETAMPPKRGPGGRGPGGRGPGGPRSEGGRGERPPGAPGEDGPGGPRGPGNAGGGRFGPPPKPLTPEQVGVLRAWVDQGAK